MKKEINNILDGKKLLLSLLYSSGGEAKINNPIIGKTRLTKMIFLFEKEVANDFSDGIVKEYEFEPYLFGPFCKELLSNLEFFIVIGLIQGKDTEIPIKYSEGNVQNDSEENSLDDEDNLKDEDMFEKSYSLTETGINYVKEKIWPSFSDSQILLLDSFKKKVNSLSLDSLLNYVYKKYPKMTTKSLIVHKYLKDDKKC